MTKYEEPNMEIYILDRVATLIEISGGGNETTVSGSRTIQDENFG